MFLYELIEKVKIDTINGTRNGVTFIMNTYIVLYDTCTFSRNIQIVSICKLMLNKTNPLLSQIVHKTNIKTEKLIFIETKMLTGCFICDIFFMEIL